MRPHSWRSPAHPLWYASQGIAIISHLNTAQREYSECGCGGGVYTRHFILFKLFYYSGPKKECESRKKIWQQLNVLHSVCESCCWKFGVRYIYKTLSHGKERDEEKRLAKPQTEPTFLCIFDTVQVTKVPTINVKNLMALFCEKERQFKCSTHMKWHEKIFTVKIIDFY